MEDVDIALLCSYLKSSILTIKFLERVKSDESYTYWTFTLLTSSMDQKGTHFISAWNHVFYSDSQFKKNWHFNNAVEREEKYVFGKFFKGQIRVEILEISIKCKRGAV